jgi:hypothetical protein
MVRGVYKGRKPSIDPAKIKQMEAEGLGPSAIAKAHWRSDWLCEHGR